MITFTNGIFADPTNAQQSICLCRVIQHSQDNRMQPQNLAIVFGPTLMSSMANNNLAVNVVHQGQLVEFMIIETCVLFV